MYVYSMTDDTNFLPYVYMQHVQWYFLPYECTQHCGFFYGGLRLKLSQQPVMLRFQLETERL